jgi:hypothetical protein
MRRGRVKKIRIVKLAVVFIDRFFKQRGRISVRSVHTLGVVIRLAQVIVNTELAHQVRLAEEI